MDEGDRRPHLVARPGKDAPFKDYRLGAAYDEMFESDGAARAHYSGLLVRLSSLPPEELQRRQQACEQFFLHQGITFTVYGDEQSTERIIPTDLLPRIVTAAEWATIERGLTQRIVALNLFLRDIYNEGRILADGVVPRELVYGAKHFRREMRGMPVPRGRLRLGLRLGHHSARGWRLRRPRGQSCASRRASPTCLRTERS